MKNNNATLIGALIAVVFGGLFFLAIGEFGVRLLYPHWKEFYSGRFIQTEQVVGRSRIAIGTPNFDGYFAQNNGDFRIAIRINESGLRNPEPVASADGRVWIIGDSMAFGWGVEQPEMYSSVISAQSGVKTYNIASPGTDVCGYQSLTARIPKSVTPKAVIVGLILENDIREYDCLNEAAKKLETINNSEPQSYELMDLKMGLTRHSALYNFVAVSVKRAAPVVAALKVFGLIKQEHAYKLTFDAARVKTLAKSVTYELIRLKEMFGDTVPFAVLIAPARFEIRDGDPLYRDFRIEIAKLLVARGIDVIDPFPGFKKAGFQPTHFAHDGHWSVLGHEIAGKAAAKWVAALPDQQ